MGRGRKIGIAFGIMALVVGGALVAVDRFAVGVAEDRISQQAKTELATRNITTAADPKVKIVGFPFLTQVLAGNYQKITIGFLAPKAEGIQFERIDMVVASVAADTASILRGSGTVTAAKVTGTAVLGWDAVRQALEVSGLPGIDASGVEVTVQNNVLHLRFPLAVAGQQGAVTAEGTLQVDAGVITVKLTEVKAEGAAATPLVQRAIDQNRSRMSGTLKIPDMPYELVIRKVSSAAAGLTIVADAANVVLAGR